jgi:thioesterase domain-containing protein
MSLSDKEALQHYLYEHIPLSRAMQIGVENISADSLTLSAPLAPNINHFANVFGGSASAVAILSAWSLLHTRMKAAGIRSRLVIQSNTMSYDESIAGDFIATAQLANPDKWDSFVRMFQRKGKARISVKSALYFGGKVAGRLEGEFVALGADSV